MTRLRVLGWPAFSNRHEQPYNALLYEHMDADVAEATTARIASGRYDILHLHWPDRRISTGSAARAAVRSAALIALLDLAHARHMKIVWTVHNLVAHDGVRRPRLEARYWDALTSRLDAFICMSESGVEAARARYSALQNKRAFVIPHPHYRGVYPDDVSTAEARAALGIARDAHVIAFVGQVRPYKNVPALVRAFRSLTEPKAALLVAGKAKPHALAEALKAEASQDKRIQIHLDFVPDNRLQVFLRAADLVALPYRDILNSGSALLALSFDRPIIVPRLGAMADLQRNIGADWVRTYDGEITTAVLGEALDWSTAPKRPEAPDLSDLGWSRIAAQTRATFLEILEPGRSAPDTR